MCELNVLQKMLEEPGLTSSRHQRGTVDSRDTATSRLHSVLGKHRGARRSSVVRAFTHGQMGRRIDPSWGGPIELFLVPASAPRLV